ncbi:glycosyl hydrolase family 28-related protein [Microlunatus sp. GCM10028923]|uniref:right-handed parallel beta-helix repeat-containing protein n=1 Tax=Microlunatus sp. GCM10028923 TaxID=3273400 RepID=UPI00360D95AF
MSSSSQLGRRSFVGLGGAVLGAVAASPFGAATAFGAPREVHVRDFGARPDDDTDDTEAIRAAIAAASATGRPTVVRFDAGTYRLRPDTERGASLPITGAAGLTLAGRTTPDGAPATRLLSAIPLANDLAPATQFQLIDCHGLTLRDLILDYAPRATTSGEIVAVDAAADLVTVDVFEGSAHFDGMRCYSANSWDLATGQLNHVAPLTIGANPDQFSNVWHSVPGGAGRRYTITGFGFSDRVRPGDGASWHFNVVGGSYNVYALGCRDLRLENLLINNAIGAGILAGYGHNLTCRDVTYAPAGPDLAVGPRDAIHLSNNTGLLDYQGGRLAGVRWDPLVSRSSFVRVAAIESARKLTIEPTSAGSRPLPFSPGDELTFWSGPLPSTVRIAAVTPADEAGSAFLIMLDADLPGTVAVGSLVTSSGHEWDQARISATTFEGNIGTALVFMNKNLVVEHCRFANNAYHDIGFGTTSGPTGSFARNVIVRDNVFAGSGWVRKYAKFASNGAITTLANNGAFTTQPYNSAIMIENNRFSDLTEAGVYLRNARDVTVRGNSYHRVTRRVVVDEASTEQITVAD